MTALITGATGGMGAAAVEALAKEGHPVLMACRNMKKPESGVQPALRALREEKQNRYYVGKKCNHIPARYINPSLDKEIWEETQKLIQL